VLSVGFMLGYIVERLKLSRVLRSLLNERCASTLSNYAMQATTASSRRSLARAGRIRGGSAIR